MLAGRRKKKTVEAEESEETEEEETGKRSPPRRTFRDLVAKKMSGGATIGKGRKSRKGRVPSAAGMGKKVPQKKVPSWEDSGQKHVGERGLQGLLLGVSSMDQCIKLSMTRVRSLISMVIGFLEMMRSRLWRELSEGSDVHRTEEGDDGEDSE